MNSVEELIKSRPGFSDMQAAHQQQATKINDFIYMSEGTSNSYMVLTDAGRVIINTGMGFEALTHKKIFDAVCPGPTPYILITQGHVDHVGGVGLFRKEGTKMVVQANNAICQRDDERIHDIRISQAHIWLGKVIDSAISVIEEYPEVLIQDIPIADITFEDYHSFELGGVEFEIYATPGGETIDSSVIWLPQHGILFSGNVFGPLFPHFPNFNTVRGDKYRYAEPYLASLARIRALEPEILITGHFEPIVGKALIKESLDRLEAAVEFIHNETLKGMNSGIDIHTLMREVQLPEHLKVGVGYGKISWAVRTTWESYMGWFKTQSTTELYPTQANEIYADLIELAGIEQVVTRGRQKLDANNPEAALHLAEVALAAEPTHLGALTLARDTHKVLLQRSNSINFWEAGWLNDQIKILQQAIDSIT